MACWRAQPLAKVLDFLETPNQSNQMHPQHHQVGFLATNHQKEVYLVKNHLQVEDFSPTSLLRVASSINLHLRVNQEVCFHLNHLQIPKVASLGSHHLRVNRRVFFQPNLSKIHKAESLGTHKTLRKKKEGFLDLQSMTKNLKEKACLDNWTSNQKLVCLVLKKQPQVCLLALKK